MSFNRQRQMKLVFLLHNEVWFFRRQHSFHHSLLQRCVLCTLTKCHVHSGSLPTVIFSRLLSVAYIYNNFISRGNIANGHMHQKIHAAAELSCFREVQIITRSVVIGTGMVPTIRGQQNIQYNLVALRKYK